VKALCFGLFIFSVGYKSGPQFFASLNPASLRQIILAVVVCVTGLLGTVAAAKIFDLDVGTAAGVLAGACTESASIGTAGEAIGRLGLDEATRKTLENNIAVGYAMTYLFGTLGVILFVRSLAPKLLGINLKQCAEEYEAKHGQGDEKDATSVEYLPVAVRAFRVAPGSPADGMSIADVREQLGPRVAVGRLIRNQQEVPVGPDVILRAGDTVGVTGKRGLLAKGDDVIGPEIGDQRVLADAVHVADVVVTSKEVAGKTLFTLATSGDAESTLGVYVQRISRGGRVVPHGWDLRIERGDVIRLVGWKEKLDEAVEMIGYEERPTEKTDLVYLALGVVLGTMLGLLVWNAGGIPLTLGTGGGVLVSGLVFGWLRSRQRRFGAFPPPAQSIFIDFGLAGFVAVVGLAAGPQMLKSMQQNGPMLVLIGLGVALLPQIVGLAFGRLVLRMHPLVLLGGLAGSQTVTAALNAVMEEADSSAPVVGYTVTYAVGNVLLTLWGPVIVGMLA
jgi:putative transport protein